MTCMMRLVFIVTNVVQIYELISTQCLVQVYLSLKQVHPV